MRHLLRTRLGPPLRVLPAIVLVVAAFAPAACSSSDDDVLTIYSGRELDLIGPILERFAEERGIDIEVRDGTTADLALLINEEGDRSPADVFLSQSPGAVGFLDGQGRLGAPARSGARRRACGRTGRPTGTGWASPAGCARSSTTPS